MREALGVARALAPNTAVSLRISSLSGGGNHETLRSYDRRERQTAGPGVPNHRYSRFQTSCSRMIRKYRRKGCLVHKKQCRDRELGFVVESQEPSYIVDLGRGWPRTLPSDVRIAL
jgi:hypothetical protein